MERPGGAPVSSEGRKPLVRAKTRVAAPAGAAVAPISVAPLGLPRLAILYEWLTPLATDFRPLRGRSRRTDPTRFFAFGSE